VSKEQPEFIYRDCPVCGKELKYKNTVYSRSEIKKSIKLKIPCRSCANRISSTGERNPFFGKKHSAETIDLISLKKKGLKQTGKTLEKSRKTIKKAKAAQKGKSVYELWLSKYGKEIADEKMIALKKLQSLNTSGKNNPMFGRPAPQGSGNGWKGRYKGKWFSSLRELIFRIDIVEKNKFKCVECHAKKEYKIPYIDRLGKKRNYFPDFLVNKTLYECKPIKLWNTPNVSDKKKAAEKFCAERGLEYKFYDCNLDDFKSVLLSKYKNGEIIFTTGCEEKFKNYHKL
jgi:hypothetical protein